MSQTTQTLSWEEWRLWGQGYAWSTRYTASSVITVTRNIGSDTATVKVDTTMTTPSGDSSLGDWQCIISINGASSGGGEKTFTVASAGYHAERSSYTVSQTYTVNVGVSAGTLSGQIKMRIGGYSGYQGEYSEAKAWSLTYDTKGTPSQATWSNAYFGNASTITIQRTVPDFRESVYLVWQDDTSHPVTIRTYSQSSATTISYTIPYNALPTTAQTRSAKIRVVSYNGSTQIGTWETSAVSVTVKSGDTTYLPTLSANPVAEAYNDVVSALGTDTAVAQYSKINVKANKSDVSLKYSATIVSRVVTFSNGSSASADQTNHISSLIQSAGDVTWTYTVTDSRGFKVTRTGTYTVINSSAPSITSVTVYRGNSSGTAVDGGDYIYATATATCESLNEHNTVTLQGKVGSGSYQNMTNGTRKTLMSNADPNTQYVVTLKATDLLRTTTMDFILPSADCPFHIPSGKHGMGIGMKAQASDNTLYVGYDAKFYGKLIKHDSINNRDADLVQLTPKLAQTLSTEITANKNINSTEFLKVGQYFCPSSATAPTLTNCPTRSAFSMTVEAQIQSSYDNESSTWVYRLRRITEVEGYQWIQYCYKDVANWVYGAWVRITTSKDCLINKGDISGVSGVLSDFGTWMKNNYVASQYCCVRVTPNNSTGYFGASSFGAIFCLSSANYGWALLQSDNAKMMVLGRLSGGTWYWHYPVGVEKTTYANTSVKRGALVARRQGNVVSINSADDAVGVTANTWVAYVQLGERYRPNETVYVPCANVGTVYSRWVRIANDGWVYLFSSTAVGSASNFGFSTSYIVD